jgi:hypothetical protein
VEEVGDTKKKKEKERGKENKLKMGVEVGGVQSR